VRKPRVSFARGTVWHLGVMMMALQGWVWLDIRFGRYWVTLYLWKGK
jgi:hypothetical protein